MISDSFLSLLPLGILETPRRLVPIPSNSPPTPAGVGDRDEIAARSYRTPTLCQSQAEAVIVAERERRMRSEMRTLELFEAGPPATTVFSAYSRTIEY